MPNDQWEIARARTYGRIAVMGLSNEGARYVIWIALLTMILVTRDDKNGLRGG